jgi:hypothetical protein
MDQQVQGDFYQPVIFGSLCAEETGETTGLAGGTDCMDFYP